MNHRLATALESHPSLGWLASFVSIFLGWVTWVVEHADDIAKGFAIGAGAFGVAAGYYTFRIQRRTWQRLQKLDETGSLPKDWMK